MCNQDATTADYFRRFDTVNKYHKRCSEAIEPHEPESASLVAGLPRPLPFKRHEDIFVFPDVGAFYFYPRIVAMIYLSSARSLSGSMQRKVQRVGQRYSMLAAESPMFAPTSIETANNAGDVRTFINNF